MVNPRVIAIAARPEIWQGFAFGCGIDRLAMLKYGWTIFALLRRRSALAAPLRFSRA